MKHYILVGFISFSCLKASSQNILAEADNYYADGNFYEAAKCYNQVLVTGKATLDKNLGYQPYSRYNKALIQTKNAAATAFKRPDIIYRLAESYRQYTNYESAETYYKKSLDSAKSQFPLSGFWYATCLRHNQKFEEAEKQFGNFLNDYKSNDLYRTMALNELQALKNRNAIISKKDTVLYTVAKVNQVVSNNEGLNMFAAFDKSGDMYFTSSRLDSNDLKAAGSKNPKALNHLYKVVDSKPKRVNFNNDTLNTNKGACTFSPDGKKMYFTVWTVKGSRKMSSIYVSTKDSYGNWGEPKKLGNSINVPGSDSKQPHVTRDGKYLLFSSNRPGGIGGFDLWYAPLQTGGQPGTAINLGSTINSFADEQSPFFHQETNNLVFSTNGRLGLGGFDLFKSKGSIEQGWKEPINLGYPINSSKDELDFSSNSDETLLDKSYFSSDKGDVCCPQIYQVHKEVTPKKLTGVIVDEDNNQPISDTTVTVKDSITGKTLYTFKTDAAGKYSVEMKKIPSMVFSIEKENYHANRSSFKKIEHAEELETDELEFPQVKLSKIVVVRKVIAPPIIVYFDFDQSSLTPLATKQLDSMAERLRNDTSLVIEIQGNTDSKGSADYNKKLGERRAKSCLDYLLQVAKVSKERLSIVSNGMDKQAVKDLNAEGVYDENAAKMNRRVEFRIIRQTLEVQ